MANTGKFDFQMWTMPPQTQIWSKSGNYSQAEKAALRAAGGVYDPETGSYYVKSLGSNRQRAEGFVASLEAK
jgi:hypothetical protein